MYMYIYTTVRASIVFQITSTCDIYNWVYMDDGWCSLHLIVIISGHV